MPPSFSKGIHKVDPRGSELLGSPIGVDVFISPFSPKFARVMPVVRFGRHSRFRTNATGLPTVVPNGNLLRTFLWNHSTGHILIQE